MFGTFFLVLVAAGAGVVTAVTGGSIGRSAAVVAPALVVAAVILSTGAVSGAHLNPIVTVAFALRREFPWHRIPGYVAAQTVGGVLACSFLRAVFGVAGNLGATVLAPHFGDVRAIAIEGVLSLGLVSTVLGTASGAQNVGPLSAFAVAGYIALAGLWSSPLTGASMNPVRTLAPDLLRGNFADFDVYLIGPAIGMLLAVGSAYVLRGPGADISAAKAAQGSLGEVFIAPLGAQLHPPEGVSDPHGHAADGPAQP
jgi:aquaporin Z